MEVSMAERLNYPKASPEGSRAMYALEMFVKNSGLDHSLLELIKLRVSQINGCAFCVDMHWKDARAEGETEERLYMLSAWGEATVYSAKERAALALAESVTLVSQTHVPDDVYNEAKKHFTETELVDLVLAIVTINGWNRLAITFRSEPGKYQPAKKRESSLAAH
jgi:AhpD family alkylhydroperoxidase